MESSSENKYGVQGGVLCLLLIGGTLISANMQGKDLRALISLGIQAVVLAGLFVCCLQLKKEQIFACMENTSVLTAVMGLSVVLAVIPDMPTEVPFYMVGGMLAAMVCDMGTGAVLTAILMLLHMRVTAPETEFAVLLMEGVAFSMLAVWLRKKTMHIWVLVCAEAVTALLTLFSYNFILNPVCKEALVLNLVGTLCMFGIVLLCGHWCVMKEQSEEAAEQGEMLNSTSKETEKLSEQMIAAAEGVEAEKPAVENGHEELKSIDEAAVTLETVEGEQTLADEAEQVLQTEETLVYNTALLERLQAELPKVYRHSERVAELSAKAAMSIGADALLCEAAGWHHEIGKLVDKKAYIAAGVKLLEENQFPERIQAVVRQTSGKLEMPKSPEAAIVMLSEGILSTIQFLKIKQETVAMDKIVENNFQIRLLKGVLDETGLTLKDYTALKRFYLLEFAEEQIEQ